MAGRAVSLDSGFVFRERVRVRGCTSRGKTEGKGKRRGKRGTHLLQRKQARRGGGRGGAHGVEKSTGQGEILVGEHDSVTVGHAGEVWLC